MQRRNYVPRELSQHLFAFITIIFLTSSFNLTSAQTDDEQKPSLNTGTIEEQYDYMVDKSSNYEDYKVIKKAWVFTFRAHFADSVKSMRGDIVGKQILINQKDSRIDSLNSLLQQTRIQLQTAIKERDSLILFGMRMHKNLYNGILWTLIVGLIAILAVFITLFKRSNKVTVQMKRDLNELKEEFEDHRKHTREQMEVVKRKHLDEINKMRNSH